MECLLMPSRIPNFASIKKIMPILFYHLKLELILESSSCFHNDGYCYPEMGPAPYYKASL